MADKSDADLKRELLSLGVTNIGPITDSTRPLYVKKLLRLKGEQKKNVAKVRKQSPGRVHKPQDTRSKNATVVRPVHEFSSDESSSETEVSKKIPPKPRSDKKPPTVSQPKRSLRSRHSDHVEIGNASTSSKTSARHTAKQRGSQLLNKSVSNVVTSRTTNDSFMDEGPLMKSAYLQTSLNSTVNRTAGFDESDLSRSRSFLRSEFSDSDADDTEDFTSLRSSNVGGSFGLPLNGNGYQSAQSRFRSNFHKGKLSSLHNSSRSRMRDSLLDQTGVMGTDGFKTTDVKADSKLPSYVSKFLVLLLVIFFGAVLLMYANIQMAETTLEKG